MTDTDVRRRAAVACGLATRPRLAWLPLLAMAWVTSALSGIVEDQYIFGWHASHSLAIGGHSEQMLAQTYTSRRDGTLDHVAIVVGCSVGSSGLVTVELRSVLADGSPSATVLGATSMPATAFPAEATFQAIPMPPVRINSGTDYALVIRGTDDLACATRRGASFWFHSPDVGPAFFDARPNPPGWAPLTHMGADAYLPFRTWVDVGDPSSPRYCDFETADGTPNNWIPNDVPLCGCARDPGLVAHRCWFATPDFMLWRTLHFDRPRMRAEWRLIPMVDDLPGLTIKEYDPDGQFASDAIQFKSGAQPGRQNRQKSFYSGASRHSEVMILIEREPEPTTLIFETLLDIPESE